MSREIRAKQSYLREQNKLYPNHMVEVPRSQWPRYDALTIQPIQVWRSSRYLAQLFPPINGVARLSIIRSVIDGDGNWMDGLSWDELMAVKRECGDLATCWAVELFPPEADIVNVANMRHLWILPSAPDFAWRRP